jgi:hypothetical protein
MSSNEGLWKVPVAAVVPVLVVVALALILRGFDRQIMVIFYGSLAASLFGSAAILLCRFNLSVEIGSPEEVLSQLAHSLRVSRFTVKEEKKSISVRITSTAAIKIRARAANGATVVSYTPDATSGGWTVYVIFVISGFGTFLALPMAVYLFLKARRMAHECALPRLPSTGAKPRSADETGISEILVDSLSEGKRIANEAYEAMKSNYEDEVIVSLIVSVVLFMVALAGSLYLFPLGYDVSNAAVIAVLSLAISACFGYAVIHYLRKTRKPRINEIKAWEERLGKELDVETSSRGRGENEASVLELLLETSIEIPRWEKDRARGFLYHYPGTGILLVGCAILACYGAVAILSASGDVNLAILGMAMLAVGIIGGALLYMKWKRDVREDQEMFSKAWDRRIGILKSDMQRILEGM